MAVGKRGRRAESRRRSTRRRAGGPAAAASDPGGAGADDGARLQVRSGGRALGPAHGESLCGVPARRGPAAGERVKPGRPEGHARPPPRVGT